MRRVLTTLLILPAIMAGTLALSAPADAGSICRDGSWTASEGSGTCSHHGGVAQSGVAAPGSRPVVGSGASSSSSASSGSGGSGYSRSAFRHWTRQADGCTTRQLVLIREAIGGRRSGCEMVDATWKSRYDGVTTSNPSTFDIDHFVPLKEAWVSGASTWSAAKRQAFANDLASTNTLIAVSASSNRSKGDKDPSKWLPPDPAQQCWYVKRWQAVKKAWKLTMDAAERSAIARVLKTC